MEQRIRVPHGNNWKRKHPSKTDCLGVYPVAKVNFNIYGEQDVSNERTITLFAEEFYQSLLRFNNFLQIFFFLTPSVQQVVRLLVGFYSMFVYHSFI